MPDLPCRDKETKVVRKGKAYCRKRRTCPNLKQLAREVRALVNLIKETPRVPTSVKRSSPVKAKPAPLPPKPPPLPKAQPAPMGMRNALMNELRRKIKKI